MTEHERFKHDGPRPARDVEDGMPALPALPAPPAPHQAAGINASSAAPRLESYFVVSNPEPVATSGIDVLFAGHSQTKPGHRLGPKVVDYYLLHHVLAGRGEFAVRGEAHSLCAGDSFLIGPGELVRYESDPSDPWMYRWVAFRGDGAAALLQSAGLTPDSPVARTGGSLRPGRCIRAIERAFHRRSPGAALEACGHLQLLFAAYRDALPADDPNGGGAAAPPQVETTVRQAIQYLSTQYAEPVTIELMAETLGYNRAYLSMLFKRETGVTPVTFLLRLRLDKARHLLRERLDLTTGQIAASVGFQDPLHFSKQFHRRFGQSPSEYRAAVRKF